MVIPPLPSLSHLPSLDDTFGALLVSTFIGLVYVPIMRQIGGLKGLTRVVPLAGSTVGFPINVTVTLGRTKINGG